MSKVSFKDYKKLTENGKKIYNGTHLIFYTEYPQHTTKVAAKKKLGNAVQRNYEKRILRYILNSLQFKKNYLILVIALKKSDLTFERKKEILSKALAPLLKRS